MSKNILCSISTKGRYDTTLPLAMMSVVNQTLKPDKLIIFDDNDNPIDVREQQVYLYIFQMLDLKGIQWEWVFAEKKGQHYNHQKANKMGYNWVWRMDDDTVAESNTLKVLYSYVADDVGAVGGSVLTPPLAGEVTGTGKIKDIYYENNLQWYYIKEEKEVDHLHCSFLYRAGIVDYNLGLSKVAHREETLFTYALKQRGYKNLIVPNAVTWHLKNKKGGIRDGHHEMFMHDEQIFKNILNFSDNTIVVLDCGMGDHIVFKKVLPDIKNPIIFTCYPEIIPGRSIAEAKHLFGAIEQFNVYQKMDQWNWKDSLENGFRKLYVEKA
jgi:hypothetical protein